MSTVVVKRGRSMTNVFRCKKGSSRNLDGTRKYWNRYKKKCQRSKQSASRRPCKAGYSRNGTTKRCRKGSKVGSSYSFADLEALG